MSEIGERNVKRSVMIAKLPQAKLQLLWIEYNFHYKSQ